MKDMARLLEKWQLDVGDVREQDVSSANSGNWM